MPGLLVMYREEPLSIYNRVVSERRFDLSVAWMQGWCVTRAKDERRSTLIYREKFWGDEDLTGLRCGFNVGCRCFFARDAGGVFDDEDGGQSCRVIFDRLLTSGR